MPCKKYDNNSRNDEDVQLGYDKLNSVGLTTFKYVGSSSIKMEEERGASTTELNLLG